MLLLEEVCMRRFRVVQHKSLVWPCSALMRIEKIIQPFEVECIWQTTEAVKPQSALKDIGGNLRM